MMTRFIDSIKTPFLTQPFTWGDVANGAQHGIMSGALFSWPVPETNLDSVGFFCFFAFRNMLLAKDHSFFKQSAGRLNYLQYALCSLAIWNAGIFISKSTSKVDDASRYKYLEGIDDFIGTYSLKMLGLLNSALILSDAQEKPYRAVAYLVAGASMLHQWEILQDVRVAVGFVGFAPAFYDTAQRTYAAVRAHL